eukprot:m.880491 g.880491  ORF g.880491 m.880491 type:complete len:576 (+) comp23591_c2_seq2:412-2139(+)
MPARVSLNTALLAVIVCVACSYGVFLRLYECKCASIPRGVPSSGEVFDVVRDTTVHQHDSKAVDRAKPSLQVEHPITHKSNFVGRTRNNTTEERVPSRKYFSRDSESIAEGGADITRRDKVVSMMQHAWNGYVTYAWGANELKALERQRGDGPFPGATHMGATIIDALDTLMIMGMDKEVAKAREWVATQFELRSYDMSFFETNIRFLGGLLGAYAQSHDDLYKTKAVELGDVLMKAFDPTTGLPYNKINMKTHRRRSTNIALAEAGTVQLEFEYLSVITGDPRYAAQSRKCIANLLAMARSDGMYTNYYSTTAGRLEREDVSLGAMGDSFYEYLLKTWVFYGGRHEANLRNATIQASRQSFDQIMAKVFHHITPVTKQTGLVYFAEQKRYKQVHTMGHLVCFMGGVLGMAATHAPSDSASQSYITVGKGITKTCREGYKRSKTGLGPEMMLFSSEDMVPSQNLGHRTYFLRPEVVESYFYMWRLTKQPKYREWAWDVVQALETHCRCGDMGYCGLRDVENPQVKNDAQESYFLAETLKYLYLIFSDDDVVSIDEYVFNTEAHPLPIQNIPRRAR